MGLLEKETPAVAAEQTVNPAPAAEAAPFEHTMVVEGERLPTSGTVKLRTISSRKEKLEFVRLSWELYKNEPNWVPPLEMDRMRLIDEEKNALYRHARLRLWIAEKNGKPVGRIGAIVNEANNRLYGDRVGFFGFFESVNDQDVANTLFNAASDWLYSEGMTSVRGPISPSMNDEVGLLVDGFDIPAAVQMPYNPRYYTDLIARAGFRGVKDLFAWNVPYPECMNEKLVRVTDVLRKRGGITVRQLNMKKYPDEIERIKKIYNTAWQPNWGFVPMADDEMDQMAYELKQIVDPNYVLFAEKDGETVGFALAVPNINQAFLAGSDIPPGPRNLPTAIMNLMTKKKQIRQLRIIILGVLPQYQGRGVDALLYREIMERAASKNMTSGEASWVLEDNTQMSRAAQMMNAEPYKRYRIYEKEIAVR
jgi:GNAT superfamily N-acetyltransferase